MAELNKILLIGRLTKDPEMRYTTAGMAVITLRMAVNHSYFTKDEGKKQEVLYIDANFWGKQAETLKKYTTKGKELLVEGRLQMNDWTDKQGQKRRDFRINGDNFQFLGSSAGGRQVDSSEGGQGNAYDGGDTAPGSPASAPQDAPPQQAQEDDLPF
ncbi:MAG: single-stranded DNA-binding protein [Planctomycetes bacterium]|nr:single-stranded DNA-binding protein [Planctomycetota bacterium]